MKLLLTFILFTGVCFGQSKKVQIADLNKRVDSLNTVLSTTRDNSANEIGILNDRVKEVKDDNTNLKTELTNLQNLNTKLTKENDKLKMDLGGLTQQNLALEAKLRAIEKESIMTDGFDSFSNSIIGKIKLGQSLSDVSMLRGYAHRTVDPYNFWIDGGDAIAHVYSKNNIDQFALVTSDNVILYIVPMGKNVLSNKGVYCGMSLRELLQIFPKLKVEQSEMNDCEYAVIEEKINYSLTFNGSAIGDYSKSMIEPSIPINLNYKVDVIVITE